MKRQLIYHTHIDTKQTAQIQVKISTDDTQETCFLDSVSRDGLTLSCDARTLHALMPNKASVAPKNPIELSASFTLQKHIETHCRVIFARRLSKDQFLMELKFVDVSEQYMSYLDDFIEKSLTADKNKVNKPNPTEIIKDTKQIDIVNLKNNVTLKNVA